MKKSLLVVLCVLFAHGCSLNHINDNSAQEQDECKYQKKSIKIKGALGIKLIDSYKEKAYVLEGKKEAVAHVNVSEANDKIVIYRQQKHAREGNIVLVVNSYFVKSLSYEGNTTILSKTTKPLDLKLATYGTIDVVGSINVRNAVIKGTGKVHFNKLNSSDLKLTVTDAVSAIVEGDLKLTRLDISDCGWAKVVWNKSEYLKVTGKDKGFAQVAGVASTIDVNLLDGAHFNGKYLRAEIAYVKTYNLARADIFAKSMSYALANDQSNIYTYKESDIQFEDMNHAGAVMDRRS